MDRKNTSKYWIGASAVAARFDHIVKEKKPSGRSRLLAAATPFRPTCLPTTKSAIANNDTLFRTSAAQ